jgi:hypothetical protein
VIYKIKEGELSDFKIEREKQTFVKKNGGGKVDFFFSYLNKEYTSRIISFSPDGLSPKPQGQVEPRWPS